MAIKVDFTADNQGIISSLEQTQKVVQQLSDSAKKAMSGVGDEMSKMGDQAATSLTSAAQTLYKGLTESAQKTLKDLEDVQHKINNLELQFKADPDNTAIKKSLEEECDKREQIARVMQEQADQLEAIISVAQRENGVQEETAEHVKSIGEQYNDLTASVAATNKELNDSDKKIQSLGEKLKSLKDPSRQETRAYESMNAAIEELAKIKNETAEYASLVEDSQSKVDALTSRIAELKKQKDDLYALEVKTNNSDERQRYKQEAADIETTIASLKKKLEYNQEALKSHQEDLSNSQKAEEAQQKAVERTTNAYKNKKQAREDSLNDTSAKLAKEIQSHEQINKALDDQKAKLGEVGKKYESQVVSVDNLKAKLVDMLKQAAAMGGITIGLAGIKSFFEQCVNVHKEMEALHYSMNTLLGDAGRGDQMFNELREFAAKTPLQLKDLAAGAQTMLGFNIEAEKVIPMLKAIGDISMGDGQKLQSLTLAFSQMSATGKLMGQDLLQMINAGFNPLTEISRKTGESVADLKEKMSKGAISVEMVTDAFLSATQEGGKFYGMLLGQGEALVGMKNTMQGALNDMYDEIGTKLMPVVQGSIELTTSLAQNWEKVGAVIVGVVSSYGFYKGAVLTMTAVDTARIGITKTLLAQEGGRALAAKLTTVEIIKQTAATKLLALAQAALKAINPYAFIATTVVAIGAALVYAATTTEDAAKAQERYNKAFDGYGASVDEAKNAAQSYLAVIRDTTKSEVERYEAWKKMQSEFPELVKGFTMLQIANMSAADATDLLNKFMERQMKNDIVSDIEKYQKRVDELNEKIAYYNEKDKNGNLLHVDTTGMMSRYQKELEKILPLLQAAKDKLLQIDEARVAFIDSQIDIDVKIQDAEDNIATMEKMKGWMDKMTESMQFKVEGKIDEEQMNKSIDEVEAEVQKAIDDTQAKLLKNPLSFEARMEMNTLEDVKKKIEKARSDFKLWGYDVVKFSLMYDPIASGQAIEEAKGDLLRLQGMKEADTKKPVLTEEEKKKQQEAARAAREQREREAVAKKSQEESMKKMLVDIQRTTDQAIVDAMEDGNDKKLAQIDLDHKNRLAAITKQYDDLAKQYADGERKIWEAQHKDQKWTDEQQSSAISGFANTAQGKAAKASVDAQVNAENVAFDKNVKAETQARQQALLDYLKEYGSTKEKIFAIEQEYQIKIGNEQDEWRRASLEKELAAKREEVAAKSAIDNIKSDPSYVQAMINPANVATEGLQKLRDYLQSAKTSLAELDPTQLRELADLMNGIDEEMLNRDPFKAYKESKKVMAHATNDIERFSNELNEANEELKTAMANDTLEAYEEGVALAEQIKAEAEQKVIDLKDKELEFEEGSEQYVVILEQQAKAAEELAEAEGNVAKARQKVDDKKAGKQSQDVTKALDKQKKAQNGLTNATNEFTEAQNQNKKASGDVLTKIGELGENIQTLGNQIGGVTGDVIGLIGNVLTTVTTISTAVQSVSATTVNSIKAIESATVILTIISAAIQLAQAVMSLIPTQEENYEKAIKKQKDINLATKAMDDYKLAVLEAQHAEDEWIGSSSLRRLANLAEQNDAILNKYKNTVYEMQAEYQNKKGGSWLGDLLNPFASVVNGAKKGGYGLLEGMLSGGSGAMIGNQIDRGQYSGGIVRAIDNLRIETRKKSSGFLGFGQKDQQTQDLQSWITEQFGEQYKLFEKLGDVDMINANLAREIIDKYGDKLQGQTQETLEALIELREEYDKYKEELHEYVSNLYAPLIDNFVQGVWDWFDEGKDALESFRESASNTFRDIISDFMQQMAYANIVGDFQDKMTDMYDKYNRGLMDKNEMISGMTLLTSELQGRMEEQLPIMEEFLTTASDALETIGISLRGDNFYTDFDSVRDGFMDLVTDMDATAEDFTEHFSNLMYQAMVNTKLKEQYKTEIDEWFKIYKDAAEKNQLDENSINELREKYTDIMSRMQAEARQMAELTGAIAEETRDDILGISFESFSDNFKKAVADMRKSATDFTADVRQSIYTALSTKNAEKHSQELQNLYDNLYTAIEKGTDESGKSVDEIMENIIGLYNTCNQENVALAQQLGICLNDVKAAVMNISFNDLESGFNNVIGDMTQTAEDFAEDFAKMMYTAIMKSQMANVWEGQLQQIYDDMYAWYNTAIDERSQEEYERIKKAYSDIYTDIVNFGLEVENWTGYKTSAQKNAMQKVEDDARRAAEDAAREAEQAAEEARRAWEERFNKISSSFDNVLTNMSRSVEDFKKSLNQVTFEKLFDKAYEDSIKRELETWYNRYESWFDRGGNVYSEEYQKLMRDYDALGKKAADTYDKLAESLGIENLDKYVAKTSTTFDNIASNFSSMLLDMNSDIQSFSENFTQMLQTAVINAQMQDLIDDNLKAWYKNFGQAMDDGNISDEDLANLRNEYDDLVEDALNRRTAILSVLGETGTKTQQGGSTAFQGMSQQTGDELNGRFTALQIAGESINANVANIANNIASYVAAMTGLSTNGVNQNEALQEIRDMMVINNLHLEDIARYAKLSYADFGMKLDTIANRLTRL